MPDARGHRDPLRGSLRPGEVRRRGLLRPVAPPARPVDGQPALRQRLRPAPGPARRGRRDRDLLRQARRPAASRPCSATAARRATTYIVDDVVRACMIAGGQRRRPAPTTSAAARRSRCSTWSSSCGMLGDELGHAERRPHVRAAVRARPRRARCSAARSTRRARARSSASRPRSTSRTACAARCSSVIAGSRRARRFSGRSTPAFGVRTPAAAAARARPHVPRASCA